MAQQVTFINLTQAEYDTLGSNILSGALYFTTDTKRVYKGDQVYSPVITDIYSGYDNEHTVLGYRHTLGTRITEFQRKGEYLNQGTVAEKFDENKQGGYLYGDYVTYLGNLFRFNQNHDGAWNSSHVDSVSMTSPDAILDITGNGALMVSAANGDRLWIQGYNLKSTNSASMQNESANKYDFATNQCGSVILVFPEPVEGKMMDFILDTSNPALDGTAPAAWNSGTTYRKDDTVTYQGKAWKCAVATATLGSWVPAQWETSQFSLDATNNRFVVDKGEDLQTMLVMEPGTMARYRFTLTAFAINSKPTWRVTKQELEVVA